MSALGAVCAPRSESNERAPFSSSSHHTIISCSPFTARGQKLQYSTAQHSTGQTVRSRNFLQGTVLCSTKSKANRANLTCMPLG